MVFQDPTVSLDPSFLVGAQVAEVVRRHDRVSRTAARRRVLELFEQVRLPDPAGVARRYPHELSGGMAQRVSLALALAGRPSVLIADEPTTALDVTVQAGILELLRQLRKETGMSIILVTHDWGVVADVATGLSVMYAGQIVEQAPVQDLFRQPRHPYTLGLQESTRSDGPARRGPAGHPRHRAAARLVAGELPVPCDAAGRQRLRARGHPAGTRRR